MSVIKVLLVLIHDHFRLLYDILINEAIHKAVLHAQTEGPTHITGFIAGVSME